MKRRYRVTPKGEHRFDFLGDPVHMKSDEEREEAEKKRAAMTIKDWAMEQILTFMDVVPDPSDGIDYETFESVLEGMEYSRDSLKDQTFQTTDAERTAESIRVFSYAADNLGALFMDLLIEDLIESVPVELEHEITDDLCKGPFYKTPIMPFDAPLSKQALEDIQEMFKTTPVLEGLSDTARAFFLDSGHPCILEEAERRLKEHETLVKALIADLREAIVETDKLNPLKGTPEVDERLAELKYRREQHKVSYAEWVKKKDELMEQWERAAKASYAGQVQKIAEEVANMRLYIATKENEEMLLAEESAETNKNQE